MVILLFSFIIDSIFFFFSSMLLAKDSWVIINSCIVIVFFIKINRRRVIILSMLRWGIFLKNFMIGHLFYFFKLPLCIVVYALRLFKTWNEIKFLFF